MDTMTFGGDLEFKAEDLAPSGRWAGYVSVFGNQDGNGDTVDNGAFTKTLSEKMSHMARSGGDVLYPLLWQHQSDTPVGGITSALQDRHGLLAHGFIDLTSSAGRGAYSAVKSGYVRGLSIGYEPLQSVFRGDGRHLTEIKLYEASLVTFPANDLAQVNEIKGASHEVTIDDIARLLEPRGVTVNDIADLIERQRWESLFRRMRS